MYDRKKIRGSIKSLLFI